MEAHALGEKRLVVDAAEGDGRRDSPMSGSLLPRAEVCPMRRLSSRSWRSATLRRWVVFVL